VAVLLAMPAVPVQAATATHPVLADSNTTCARVAHNAKGVLVIGDSITANGFGDIKNRLALLGHPSCINARVGRPTAEGVEVLRQYIRTTRIPHTVILALGTNDSLAAAAMPKLVRAGMFAAGASTRVFWVNAFNAQSTRPVEAMTQTRQINSTLWRADHNYWNLAVVDWSDYIAPRADYLMQSDGVHPTGLGNRARTTLMLNGMLHLWTVTGHQVMPRP
jgi:lysophospholipase L1-like esterase